MHKTCTGIKKNKKTKTLSIYSGLGVYRLQKFCFFWFFWCLCRFGEDHALVFFVFFDACASLVNSYKKSCVSPAFQTLQVQETLQITVFCAYFLSKTTPPWWPALLKFALGKGETFTIFTHFGGCPDLFVLGRVPFLSNNSRKWRFSLVRDFPTDKFHLESGEWNPWGHLNKYCMEYKEIIFYSWIHSLKLT